MKLLLSRHAELCSKAIMPRQARIDTPDALHHIICRRIERKRIFQDDEESYLLELTRYIHLNPLRAQIALVAKMLGMRMNQL